LSIFLIGILVKMFDAKPSILLEYIDMDYMDDLSINHGEMDTENNETVETTINATEELGSTADEMSQSSSDVQLNFEEDAQNAEETTQDESTSTEREMDNPEVFTVLNMLIDEQAVTIFFNMITDSDSSSASPTTQNGLETQTASSGTNKAEKSKSLGKKSRKANSTKFISCICPQCGLYKSYLRFSAHLEKCLRGGRSRRCVPINLMEAHLDAISGSEMDVAEKSDDEEWSLSKKKSKRGKARDVKKKKDGKQLTKAQKLSAVQNEEKTESVPSEGVMMETVSTTVTAADIGSQPSTDECPKKAEDQEDMDCKPDKKEE
ncbi:hypothetical protein T4A_8836, partial [Trichinella pseudospiralis]